MRVEKNIMGERDHERIREGKQRGNNKLQQLSFKQF